MYETMQINNYYIEILKLNTNAFHYSIVCTLFVLSIVTWSCNILKKIGFIWNHIFMIIDIIV